jgi:predicted membrane channel-forming protein YqfA (hemolysin III family)
MQRASVAASKPTNGNGNTLTLAFPSIPQAASAPFVPAPIGSANRMYQPQLQQRQQYSATAGRLVQGIPVDPTKELLDAESPENDQYHVRDDPTGKLSRLYHLWVSVLCHNDSGFADLLRKRGSLLGPYGHLERCSAWTHLIATIVFMGYAISCNVRFDSAIPAQLFAIIAAWTTSATFFISVIYHVTVADVSISAWTRQLDFLAIYVCVPINAIADMGAATRSFENVPAASLVDVPLSAAVLALFFAFRRAVKTAEKTSLTEFGGCTLSIGLLRRRHDDGAHTPLRQMTSFSFSIFYFTTTPVVIQRLGAHGYVVLALQLAGFAVMVLGLVADNYLLWPDRQMARGRKFPCLQFGNTCGCIVNSHALWHLLSFVSAILGIVAREYALSVI